MCLKINEQEVYPSPNVKLLGVVFDQNLRFREHVARATKRGIRAAHALARLKGVPPATARQLFSSLVQAAVLYAGSVWTPILNNGDIPTWVTKSFNAIQRVGASLITRGFKTVALATAEAEAGLEPLDLILRKRIARHWIQCHTLEGDHPFHGLDLVRSNNRPVFQSPLQTLQLLHPIPKGSLGVIRTLPDLPAARKKPAVNTEPQAKVNDLQLKVASHASSRQGRLGAGCVALLGSKQVEEKAVYIGTSDSVNLYFSHLGALLLALEVTQEICQRLPIREHFQVVITSTCQPALKSLNQPSYQSGQALITKILRTADTMIDNGYNVTVLNMRQQQEPPVWATTKLKSTTWVETRRNLDASRVTRFNRSQGGKWTKAIDDALPGRHTKALYDSLSSHQASILNQLRTGHARLNSFLARIGASAEEKCSCGHATETVKHFLFECPNHEEARNELRECMSINYGDISLALGGRPKLSSITQNSVINNQWRPDLPTVRAAIRFAAATKRLDYVPPE
ncbi:hypothetical protein N7535_008280 [Penicillium sp. DV-2018c]|nr:hypothetical protein N7461_004319 [Penicillium sp. DV-2018c]KAJ5566642.1 hypothetical protein N7535_008280 [Penicillium sp. DV-2018c]